ncbi:MAG: trypsin-like peptidase domain-containing protein [Myxococcota bacterium]
MTRFLLTAFLVACASTPAPGVSQTRSLGDLDRSLRDLAARVNPSVVRVQTVGYAPTPVPASTSTSLLARRRGVGSGVVIAPGGLVLTNYHVVAGATRVWVDVPESAARRANRRSVVQAPYERVEAEVVGVDAETDLALLRVERDNLPAIPFGDSEALRPGQLVVAFGSPLGLSGTVTMGVVSATGRQLTPEAPVVYVQTDTPINPGSSGGPLVDLQGNVIGINTLILSQSGGSEGIGLALPSHIARTIVSQLRQHGRVRRGLIGAQVQTITPVLAEALQLPQTWGVVIADVLPGSPAERAGLRPRDVIERLDNRVMENARQFSVNVYQRTVGSEVRLQVRRGEERLEVRPVVVERRDPPSLNQLGDPREHTVEEFGVIAIDMNPAFANRIPGLRETTGALVVAASPQSGFRPGDVIHAVGVETIRNFEDLRRVAESTASEASLVVRIERRGVFRYVEVMR